MSARPGRQAFASARRRVSIDINRGRGRRARSPLEIPWSGWLDIGLRVYHEIWEDRVLLVAAGTAFYALLALFPGLTAIVSIYGLVADADAVANQLSAVAGFVPADAMAAIQEHLTAVVRTAEHRLSVTFVLSLLVTLWAANNGIKALFEAMNVANEEVEKRGYIRLTLITLGATLMAIALFILTMLVVIALPAVLTLMGASGSLNLLVSLASGATLLLSLLIAVLALYRWGPSRRPAQWRWLLPGAVLAVGLSALVSLGFSWYVSQFGSYDRMYGSLGAIIAFMTWVWIISILLITGAELNAEVEHQTTIDSTVGPSRPIGERGAVMADSIGATRQALSERFAALEGRVPARAADLPHAPAPLRPVPVTLRATFVTHVVFGLVAIAGGRRPGRHRGGGEAGGTGGQAGETARE